MSNKTLIPVPYIKTRENKVQMWLNSKLLNNYFDSKYKYTKYTIKPYMEEYEKFNIFEKYYTNNDQDVKSSDKFYISLINNMRIINPENIVKDRNIRHINRAMESYRDGKNSQEINVLIPPNTNRYHTNYLFKKMIDYCDNNDFYFGYVDESMEKFIQIKLVDTDFKDAFYEFCYDHTDKK